MPTPPFMPVPTTTTATGTTTLSPYNKNNSVFPSLKAGNYISPSQETPPANAGTSIHPIIEPILPSIFASSTNSSNSKVDAVVYNNGKEFLNDIILIRGSHQGRGDDVGETISHSNGDAKTQGRVNGMDTDSKEAEEVASAGTDATKTGTDAATKANAQAHAQAQAQADSNGKEEEEKASATGEEYENNWRLEMILGQTHDLINTNENAEGIWIALWSGDEKNGTRLLE
jgi:hypothetical protein